MYKYLRPLCCYRGKINQIKESWDYKEIPDKREKIRQQVKLNDAMMDVEEEGSVEQMNFVMQYGYICLFSTVFPLASFICLIANYILFKSVKNEFEFSKRTFP